MRFLDDLQSESLISVVILIAFSLIGVLYLISGINNPRDMQELEQITQSTRIVIGQSILATGIIAVVLSLLNLIITTKKRREKEDQFTELQTTVNTLQESVNTLIEQNKILIRQKNIAKNGTGDDIVDANKLVAETSLMKDSSSAN